MLIKLTELRYCLLDYSPTDTNAAHEPPIAMRLPVFAYRRVAQIHAPESKSDSLLQENTQGWHYMPKSAICGV